MTHDQMAAEITAGGSVSWRYQIITRVEDLPTQEEIDEYYADFSGTNGFPPQANVPMGGYTFTGLSDPTSDQQAATKAYVDGHGGGGGSTAGYYGPVDCATTENLDALLGELWVDGFSTTAGNTVLVKDQDDLGQNGIYVVSAGAWDRATNFAMDTTVLGGSLVLVDGGNTQAATGWVLDAGGLVGTSDLSFTKAFPAASGGSGGFASPLTSGGSLIVGRTGLGPDIARPGTASADYSSGDGGAPSRVIDGNDSLGWITLYDAGLTHWLQVDLGSEQQATRYRILTNPFDGSYIIQGSHDGGSGGTWDDLATGNVLTTALDHTGTFDAVTYRYYRVNVTSDRAPFGLYTFSLWNSVEGEPIELLRGPAGTSLRVTSDGTLAWVPIETPSGVLAAGGDIIVGQHGDGTDLAQGKTAIADYYAGGGEPSKAVDGDPATSWSNQFSGSYNHWLQVDMATEVAANKWRIATAGGGYYNGTFTLQGSHDGGDFGEWLDVDVVVITSHDAEFTSTFVESTFRYWRVYIVADQIQYHVSDFNIWESAEGLAARLPIGDPNTYLHVKADGTLEYVPIADALYFPFGSTTSALGAPLNRYYYATFDFQLTSVTLLSDGSGASVDVWKSDYTTFDTIDATFTICGATPPALSDGDVKYTDSDLVDWIKTVVAGDVLVVNVSAHPTGKALDIILGYVRL